MKHSNPLVRAPSAPNAAHWRSSPKIAQTHVPTGHPAHSPRRAFLAHKSRANAPDHRDRDRARRLLKNKRFQKRSAAHKATDQSPDEMRMPRATLEAFALPTSA